MGRETKILLGFLGLLAGVFMGVLSMKLFVPRPPAGAGPDIHTELAAAEPHVLVEPPRLTMRASDFAAAPPLVAAASRPPTTTGMARETPPAAEDRYASQGSGFGRELAAQREAEPEPPSRRDPFVATASFEQPDDPPAIATPVEPPAAPVRTADLQRAVPPFMPPQPMPAPAPAGRHVAQPGDTWWSLAERAYGDGRLYRAVYAWNRGRDPRITLAPGTPLYLPPLAELAAAWPHLVPRD